MYAKGNTTLTNERGGGGELDAEVGKETAPSPVKVMRRAFSVIRVQFPSHAQPFRGKFNLTGLAILRRRIAAFSETTPIRLMFWIEFDRFGSIDKEPGNHTEEIHNPIQREASDVALRGDRH